jgi:hypothetical protein
VRSCTVLYCTIPCYLRKEGRKTDVCLSSCLSVLFIARPRALLREPRKIRPVSDISGQEESSKGATAEELASWSKFTEKSVTKKTFAGGEAAWARWVEYLEGIPTQRRPLPSLDNLTTEEDKSDRVSLFTQWLHEKKGYNRDRIVQELGKVKRMFETSLWKTEFFNNALQSRTLDSTRATTDEKKVIDQQKSVDKSMPLVAELALLVREEFWTRWLDDWSCKAMDFRVIWIALILSYNSGPRMSNVTLRDGPDAEDHCIRAGHLTFYFRADSRIVPVVGGEHLRTYVGGDYVMIKRNLASCSYKFLTSKAGSAAHELSRRSVHESMVLEDLCTWVLRSGVMEKDELVTRYPSKTDYPDDKRFKRAVLNQKRFSRCYSWLGEKVVLQDEFTTRCARIGYVVNGSCDALRDPEIAEGGGWSNTSKVPLQHYLVKHSLIKEKIIVAMDARLKGGNQGVPLGAWARVSADGKSSLTLAEVRVMAQDAVLLRKSLAESAGSSS